MRVQTPSWLGYLLVATSAHATHRRGLGSTDAAGANRNAGSCKHESGHDGVDVSTAALGVFQQRPHGRRRGCILAPTAVRADERIRHPRTLNPGFCIGDTPTLPRAVLI
jgi:hypothetical protein